MTIKVMNSTPVKAVELANLHVGDTFFWLDGVSYHIILEPKGEQVMRCWNFNKGRIESFSSNAHVMPVTLELREVPQ